MLVIENSFFFDVDFKWWLFAFHQSDKVSYLAFQAHVSHQTTPGFCIYPRQITRIRVTIGIAIFYVKQQNEVVTINQCHDIYSPLVVDSDLVKKACRWW